MFINRKLSVEKTPRQFDIGVTPTAHSLGSKFEVRGWMLEVRSLRLEVRGSKFEVGLRQAQPDRV